MELLPSLFMALKPHDLDDGRNFAFEIFGFIFIVVVILSFVIFHLVKVQLLVEHLIKQVIVSILRILFRNNSRILIHRIPATNKVEECGTDVFVVYGSSSDLGQAPIRLVIFDHKLEKLVVKQVTIVEKPLNSLLPIESRSSTSIFNWFVVHRSYTL